MTTKLECAHAISNLIEGSDLSKMQYMFNSIGLSYQMMHSEVDGEQVLTILCEVDRCPGHPTKIEGYMGFFGNFEFNLSGKFIRMVCGE